jgi:hypothetical protein
MYNSLALDDKKDVSEEVRMLFALCGWSCGSTQTPKVPD